MNVPVLVESACEVVAFAAMVSTVGMTATSYTRLPEVVANHFNLRGEPTQWSPRALVWLTPVVSVVFFVLQTAFNPSIAPYFPGRPVAPTNIWMPVPLTAAVLTMTLIQREILSVAMGVPRANVRVLLAGIGLLLAGVGFALVQAMSSAVSSR